MSVINTTWNFVFIHIPKCGGTSVAHTLERLCSWQDLQLGGTPFGERCHKAYSQNFGMAKHSLAYEIRQQVGLDFWQRAISFATVRNPVSRTVSTYKYLRHHREHYREFEELDTFESFIRSDLWKGFGPDRMFMAQKQWLCSKKDSGDRIVDSIVHIENYESEMRLLLDEIGVPKAKIRNLVFAKKNAMETSEEIEVSPAMRKLIEKRYAADMEMFNY